MNKEELKISMIGGGSWATAIVKTITDNGFVMRWWIRELEIIDSIKNYGRNSLYLSALELNRERLILSNDVDEVIENSDIIIFCVPSAFLTSALAGTKRTALKNKIIVSAIKGIIPDSNLIIGEYFNKEFNVGFDKFVVVSGPSHAEEVAQDKLTYLTCASQNSEVATIVSKFLNCRYIKTTISDDIYGTEYSAVLKNIYALATGVAKGLGYGDNFVSVLISNALQEIKRFIEAVHPIERDLSNSVYLGDLLVTAYSQFSRNRTFGMMIGSGYSVKSAQLEMQMIAEGYFASNCIHQINKKYNVEMPIAEAIYNILYQRISPAIEYRILSDRLS